MFRLSTGLTTAAAAGHAASDARRMEMADRFAGHGLGFRQGSVGRHVVFVAMPPGWHITSSLDATMVLAPVPVKK